MGSKRDLTISHDPAVIPILVPYLLIYITLFISSTKVLPLYYDEKKDSLRPIESEERVFILGGSESGTNISSFTSFRGEEYAGL